MLPSLDDDGPVQETLDIRVMRRKSAQQGRGFLFNRAKDPLGLLDSLRLEGQHRQLLFRQNSHPCEDRRVVAVGPEAVKSSIEDEAVVVVTPGVRQLDRNASLEKLQILPKSVRHDEVVFVRAPEARIGP